MNTQTTNFSASTSSSLLRRVKDHQPDAWQRLVDLYGPLVYFWCRRYALREQDAPDVMQNVFTAVAGAIQNFDHDHSQGTFRGWLWTIARNKIRDFYRQQQDQTHAVGGSSAQQKIAVIPEHFPEETLDTAHRDQINDLFRRGVEMVKAEFESQTWEAFWRTAVEGQSTADVAADLDITANTIRQYKSRVQRRLREELGDLLE